MARKISLITSVFNNVDQIEETLQSVLAQNYSNLEYIIIDGGSTDGTVEILKKYSSSISIFISEKDQGLYDALNKGMSLATGEIIGLLHSGDIFSHHNILNKISAKFSHFDLLYGDLVYVLNHRPDQIVRYWKAGSFALDKLKWGWVPPHPSLFIKKEHCGNFNLNYKISSDYDFMIRMLKKPGLKVQYLPEVLVKMRTGGKSNNSFKNLLAKSKEDLAIIKDNKIGNVVTLFCKKFSKIFQY